MAIFILVSVMIIFVAIWLPNLDFLRHTVTTPDYTGLERGAILWTSFGTLMTNFTPFSRITTLAIALLTGMSISLFVFYIKVRRTFERTIGTTAFGTLLGMLGVGCATCGSVVVASVIGVGATATFVGLLPLKGAEFGILGVVVLLYANHPLAKKIRAPLVCAMKYGA